MGESRNAEGYFVVEGREAMDIPYILSTRDAHELYRRHGGFESLKNPDRWMERCERAV